MILDMLKVIDVNTVECGIRTQEKVNGRDEI
jgi:hypothetical protein